LQVRVLHQKCLRRAFDTCLLLGADRGGGGGDVVARLDLDKGQRGPALGDDIDFADRGFVVGRQNAPSGDTQVLARQLLGPHAAFLRSPFGGGFFCRAVVNGRFTHAAPPATLHALAKA